MHAERSEDGHLIALHALRLGQGNEENLGDEPAEMGDALLPVNLNNLAVHQAVK